MKLSKNVNKRQILLMFRKNEYRSVKLCINYKSKRRIHLIIIQEVCQENLIINLD